MADPYDDLTSLLGGGAPSPAQAMVQALRARQLAGIGNLSGNKGIMASAQGLEQGSEGDLQRGVQQQHFAMQNAPQIELMQARKDPRYAQVLHDQAANFGLEVPEGTPPVVLEKALDRQEKLQQAQLMAQFRVGMQGKLQAKIDPNTGEQFLIRPIDGATFHMDGSPRTHGVAGGGMGGFQGGPGNGPTAAPAPRPSLLPGATSAGKPPMPAMTQGPDSAPPTGQPQPQPAPQQGPSGTFPRMMGKPLGAALQALGKDLDPNQGTGEVASNQKRLNAALRLKALVTNPDGSIKDNIPPQFMKETAAALAQLVTAGGVPAQSLIEELTPKTGSSDIAKFLQYVTAHPQDAGQQDFVKLYLESANREAGVSQQAINKALQARVPKHQRVLRGNPEESRQVLQGYGYDLDPQGNVVVKGAAAPAAPGLSEQDKAAMAWATANPKDPRAAQIMDRLKGKAP